MLYEANFNHFRKSSNKIGALSRDDDIPYNAVYAGTIHVDGKMYVARVNNILEK